MFPILPGMDFSWVDPEGTPNRRWRAVMSREVWQQVVNIRLYGSHPPTSGHSPVVPEETAQATGHGRSGGNPGTHQETPDAPSRQSEGTHHLTTFRCPGVGRTGAAFDNPRLIKN